MPDDGVPVAKPAGSGGEDAVSVIIPFKNPKALVGYYLGIFSIIPVLGLLLGPAGIVLGALGLRDRGRNPKLHGMAHAIVAIVFGAIGTIENWGFLILMIIGLSSR